MSSKIVGGLTTEEINQTIKELHNEIKINLEKEEGEFSTAEYAEINGTSIRMAYEELSKLYKKRIVTKRLVRINLVYWKRI